MLKETLQHMMLNDSDRAAQCICVGEHDGIETEIIKQYISVVSNLDINKIIIKKDNI